MKKFFILLFIFATSALVNAQIVITTPYEFSAGVSSGATFSSVSFSPKVTQGKLLGTTFGLTGRMTMGKNVGLQIELNYAQQGWNENYDEYPDYLYSRRIDYFQFPFYSHFQFGGKNVKGFLNAGPQIGYMIGESTKHDPNGDIGNRETTQHDMPVEKKFEWGISGGGGIEIRTRIGYFLLEGRYLYSLGDIYNTTRSDNFSKASGSTITTKVSYLIPFK